MGQERIVNDQVPGVDGVILPLDADHTAAAKNIKNLTEIVGMLNIKPSWVVTDAACILQSGRNGDSRSRGIIEIVMLMGHVDCSLLLV